MPEAPAPTGAPFLRFNPVTGWPLSFATHRIGIHNLDAALRLGITGRSAIPVAEPKGTFGGRTLPRGLTITSSGYIFLADPKKRVIWTARVDEASAPKPQDAPDHWPFQPLWPARPLAEMAEHDLTSPADVPDDPYTLRGPTDVAMAPNGDLVILDPAAHRLLVIAFPTAVLRHVIYIEGGAPTAIAFDRHGYAYIADPVLKTVHRYDRNWRHDVRFSALVTKIPDTHHAPFFIATHCNDTACTSEQLNDSGNLEKPVVYTLDDRHKLYALYSTGRVEVVTDHDTLLLSPKALILDADSTLLYHDPTLPHHDPIRIKGLELTLDGRLAGTNLPLLARPNRIEVPRSGHFITDALDAGIPGFSWDRITLTLEMPENTRLILQTMTSDSAIEPDRVEAQPASIWSQPLVLTPGTLPEMLVQSMPGQYLWLRVDLSGDGTQTPIIHEMDLFGPRRSALNELPAPFHQDPDSAHFLDRFLSYFDTVFAEISSRNRDIAMLFDPDTVPAAEGFLTWLGSWFDLQFLAEWDEGTRREMIREAIPYFRMRGTVDGLRKIVQWHTGLPDPLPQIIEHFRLPREPTKPIMIGGKLLGIGNSAHRFTVVLPASAIPDETAEQRLTALITASSPAHCRFQLHSFSPGITLGSQSSIGVDTLLGSLHPTGLGLGLLGSTLSTSGAETTGPVSIYSNSLIIAQKEDYPC